MTDEIAARATEEDSPRPERTRNPLRRLYLWVLHWAYTPYGAPALFLLAFAESSFFPIPPDVLLIALAISVPAKSFRFALICSAGSVLGGIAGYGIGAFLWEHVDQLFFRWIPGFTQEVFDGVSRRYDENAAAIVFAAGFTPIPYKVITISAGACEVNFLVFTVASIVSRSARFYLVAALIRRFGAPVRYFLDKHFNWISIVFTVVLIGGFIVLKALL
jgi:membrane protein YqaA with SNARE-associated domain